MNNSKSLENRVERIESLVAEGLTRKEIADKLGIKYTSFCIYLHLHPELPKPIKKSGRPQNLEKYNQIKKLIEEGLTRKEIADRLEMKYVTFCAYLSLHPELPKVKDKEYEKIKKLVDSGLSQNKISQIFEKSRQAINQYLNYHPELREIYDSQRKRK